MAIVARRLRRALRHYYEKEGEESEIRIDVPKGSYVPLFLSNNIVADSGAIKAPAEVPRDDSPPTGAPIDRASTIAVVRLDGHGAATPGFEAPVRRPDRDRLPVQPRHQSRS